MSRAAAAILIADLARELDLPELALDEQDYVCVQIEDGVVVNIDYFEEGDVLSLYTTVGEAPAEQRRPILQRMLESNFAWQGTAGATLCLDPSEELALLTGSMPLGDMDLPALKQLLADFCQLAWMWSERLQQLAADAPASIET